MSFHNLVYHFGSLSISSKIMQKCLEFVLTVYYFLVFARV